MNNSALLPSAAGHALRANAGDEHVESAPTHTRTSTAHTSCNAYVSARRITDATSSPARPVSPSMGQFLRRRPSTPHNSSPCSPKLK